MAENITLTMDKAKLLIQQQFGFPTDTLYTQRGLRVTIELSREAVRRLLKTCGLTVVEA